MRQTRRGIGAMSRLDLRCPNGCEEGRFEALNAPLYVDAAGRVAGHDGGAATYVCVRCQSVAVDMAGAAREMERRDVASVPALVCPGCGAEMLPPEDDPLAELLECPLCTARFSMEEAMPRLHGGGNGVQGEAG